MSSLPLPSSSPFGEKAYLRIILAHYVFGVNVAHYREVREMYGFTVNVAADVEYGDHAVFYGRPTNGYGRPFDPFEPFKTSIPAAMAAPLFPALTTAPASWFFTRSKHTLIDESFFLPYGGHGTFFHAHDLGGVSYGYGKASRLEFGQVILYLVLYPDKHYRDALFGGLNASVNNHRRGVIPTHRVNSYLHELGFLRNK